MIQGRSLSFCRLAAFLEAQPDLLAEIVLELRKRVLQAAPNVTETIVRGGLSYRTAERRGTVKGAMCQISIHGDHVRLSFLQAKGLPDPSGLLRGDRKAKRFVSIRTLGEAGTLPLEPMVRAAAGR